MRAKLEEFNIVCHKCVSEVYFETGCVFLTAKDIVEYIMFMLIIIFSGRGNLNEMFLSQ